MLQLLAIVIRGDGQRRAMWRPRQAEWDEPAEAEPHFREALRLRPDDPKGYKNLRIALATQGGLYEAIDVFAPRSNSIRDTATPSST